MLLLPQGQTVEAQGTFQTTKLFEKLKSTRELKKSFHLVFKGLRYCLLLRSGSTYQSKLALAQGISIRGRGGGE
jgi:hypothetical protein